MKSTTTKKQPQPQPLRRRRRQQQSEQTERRLDFPCRFHLLLLLAVWNQRCTATAATMSSKLTPTKQLSRALFDPQDQPLFAKDPATTSPEAAITATEPPPAGQHNNVMTDSNLPEAVQIWCDNPSLAEQYFGHISQWNVSAVTNFRGLFRRQYNFNDDVSRWDTARATSMAAM